MCHRVSRVLCRLGNDRHLAYGPGSVRERSHLGRPSRFGSMLVSQRRRDHARGNAGCCAAGGSDAHSQQFDQGGAAHSASSPRGSNRTDLSLCLAAQASQPNLDRANHLLKALPQGVGKRQGRCECCGCFRDRPIGPQRRPAVTTCCKMVLQLRLSVGVQFGIASCGEQRLEVGASLTGLAVFEYRPEALPSFGNCRCASYFSAVGFLFPDFALESQIAASFRKSRWVLPGRRV